MQGEYMDYYFKIKNADLPPDTGLGWSHSLCMMDTPAPQDLEHSLHGLQSPQPPSIADGASTIGTHLWFWHHCPPKKHLIP